MKRKLYRIKYDGIFSSIETTWHGDGVSFADAKRELSKHLRVQRDAYSLALREVRRRKEEDRP